eukprot:GHRQ01037528.1.p2 GENE.GHRQ01037528.1~~GHRQ01037528.1.p2  ORF type:complete len:146 (-),score=8.68 GHRQ01037528.1:192-629(-)
MADTEQAVEVEHDMEEDVLDVEQHDDVEGETGDEEAPASTACDNLPGIAADTPSGGQPVIAKLLISNAAAGSVIGKVKHGATDTPVTAVAQGTHRCRDPRVCRVVRPLSRFRKTRAPVCNCPVRASSTQASWPPRLPAPSWCDGQ